MELEPGTTHNLLQRAGRGDEQALQDLLQGHAVRLRRMVRLRLDRRLRARLDEDDVMQEVLLEATQRMPDYLAHRNMPFFLWLRFLTAQRIAGLHRHHLGVQQRDARREVRLDPAPVVGASSAVLAGVLAARLTTPTQGAARRELRARLERALERMQAGDREILALRHFEQLTNAETARELGLDVSAASKRYARALARLRQIIGAWHKTTP